MQSYLVHTWQHPPHDDGNQTHDGLVEGVEKFPECLALLLHIPNDQAKTHGEHNQPEGVNSICAARDWDNLFTSNLLGGIGQIKNAFIHYYLHMYNLFGILGFELWKVEEKDRIREMDKKSRLSKDKQVSNKKFEDIAMVVFPKKSLPIMPLYPYSCIIYVW